jgi:hypothetical protein
MCVALSYARCAWGRSGSKFVMGMTVSPRKNRQKRLPETGHDVMYFCLDLCGAVNEVNCWKDALKSFGNAVANVVACSGFVVGCTSQAVIAIFIKLLAAFACLIVRCFEDFEPELAFETDGEDVIFHLVGSVEA